MADPTQNPKPIVSVEGVVIGYDPVELNDPIPGEACWWCMDCNAVWWDTEPVSSSCLKCGREVTVFSYEEDV